jgi:hypothetical protein
MHQKTFLIAALVTASTAAFSANTPTYYKDVQPIVANRCQGCHRAGEIGPMAFTSFQDTRPWAKAIKQAVATKKMPPWFADAKHGKFSNDSSLTQPEIDTLAAWADGGAPEGNAADAKPARKFVDGWNIPTPDLVVGMKKPFPVPAGSKVDYQYIVIPLDLTEDKWVQMVEARPSDRSVVHHLVVFVRDKNSKWLREAEPYVPHVPNRTGRERRIDVGGGGNEILHIYTPGNIPDIYQPGQARLIPAGSDLVFQMHYTSTKKSTEDSTQIGMVWAKEPPKERIFTATVGNDGFVIPPGVESHVVSGTTTIPNDAKLLSFFPHMHLRGKAFEYGLIAPGTEQPETLLKVNKYDFNWQLTYKLSEPLILKPGTRLRAVGTFDNSPNNPYNPDPKAEVRWGEQSWEEMMYGFFDLAIDARHDRRSWAQRKPLGSDEE